MVLRNHGLLTVGRSVGEAWIRMWQLELACKVQVLAQSTGRAIRQAPISAIEKDRFLVRRRLRCPGMGLAPAHHRPEGPVLPKVAAVGRRYSHVIREV